MFSPFQNRSLASIVLLLAATAVRLSTAHADEQGASKNAAPTGQESPVDFQKDVLPILQNRCFSCHSSESEAPKAGLRLDHHESFGDYVFAGDLDGSYLFDLVNRTENDPERMPPENSGPPLDESQVATIRRWIEQGAEFGDWKSSSNLRNQPYRPAPKIDLALEDHAARIDAAVEAGLQKVGRTPNEGADDAVFLRRVYLDLAGRIPTLDEAAAFYAASDSTRRTDLIDRLVGSEAYVSHSFNHWADALRVQTTLSHGRSGDHYIWWLKEALRENMPYDELVRELLVAKGYSWENPAVGYYFRDVQNRLANVEATAAVFLGTDIGCAQCHNDPFDVWTRRDYHEFAAFFDGAHHYFPRERAFENVSWDEIEKERNARNDENARVRRKWNAHEVDVATTAWVTNQRLQTRVIRPEHAHPRLPHDYQYDDGEPKQGVSAQTLFGASVEVEDARDGMDELAKWLASPENPRFTLTVANRLWTKMLGTPFAGEPTDVRPIERCDDPELARVLVQTMIDLDYDLQAFLRVIARTKTYQRAATATANESAAGDPVAFPGPALRRMTAEQVWDSMIALVDDRPEASIDRTEPDYSFYREIREVGSNEEYWSKIEEFIAKGGGYMAGFRDSQARLHESRATGFLKEQLVRASELPGPAPDGRFLRQFGQSDRENIDNSWTNPTTPQALTLLNGPLFDVITGEDSALAKRCRALSSRAEQVDTVFLATLSRRPSEQERQVVLDRLKDVPDEELWKRLTWTILNTRQFLFVQ